MTTYTTPVATVGTFHQWTSRKGDRSYVLTHSSILCPKVAGETIVDDIDKVTVPTWPCPECDGNDTPVEFAVPGDDQFDVDRRPAGNGNGTGHAPVETATDKQAAFIRRLAAERAVDVDPKWLRSKREASVAIDKLMAMPKAAAAPVETPAPTGRTNRYDGRCARCGANVPAGTGNLSGGPGAWITTHTECPEKATEAPAPADGYTPARGDVHVIDGDYFRVSVGQSSGKPYTCRWTGTEWEFARGMVARLTEATRCTADQAAEFGAAFHRCVFCTRDLDMPESITVGYGPICAGKYGLPWGNKAGGSDA